MPDKTFTTDSTIGVTPPIIGGMSWLLSHKCNVRRRPTNPSRNVLNELSYGKVDTWNYVYVNIPCRLEISQSTIQFKSTGERVEPTNILYVDFSTPLNVEDRIFMIDTSTTGLGLNQEFIVQGTTPALDMVGQPKHHLEYHLIIP